MTRVNLVSPESLADQHLMAEFKEITRVPSLLRKNLGTKSQRSILDSVPHNFTLNTGHMKFFLDKMQFLCDRYESLKKELRNRSFGITEYDASDIFLNGIPSNFCTDKWSPSKSDIQVSVDRISLRISEKPTWYKYHGKTMNPDYFRELMKLELTFMST